MKKLMPIVATAFLLGAAVATAPVAMAAAPVYQAAGPKGGVGYFTAPAEEGRYVVVYTGDTKMKRSEAASYALLRAAEFTIESGFEWFAVLSTSVKDVEVGGSDDMATRTGPFMGNSVTASGGAGSDQSAGSSARGGGVTMGPSTGGFGGGDVPPSVLERWRPKKVAQAVLIIQMGKGDEASFPGLKKQPEIFDAKSTAAEIRATMAK